MRISPREIFKYERATIPNRYSRLTKFIFRTPFLPPLLLLNHISKSPQFPVLHHAAPQRLLQWCTSPPCQHPCSTDATDHCCHSLNMQRNMPPTTGSGRATKKAPTFPTQPKITISTPAVCITRRLATCNSSYHTQCLHLWQPSSYKMCEPSAMHAPFSAHLVKFIPFLTVIAAVLCFYVLLCSGWLPD